MVEVELLPFANFESEAHARLCRQALMTSFSIGSSIQDSNKRKSTWKLSVAVYVIQFEDGSLAA